MPELPEVETMARELAPLVVGAEIAEAWTDWPPAVRHPARVECQAVARDDQPERAAVAACGGGDRVPDVRAWRDAPVLHRRMARVVLDAHVDERRFEQDHIAWPRPGIGLEGADDRPHIEVTKRGAIVRHQTDR